MSKKRRKIEEQSGYDAWVRVRQNPENPRLGIAGLDVAELPYYRLNPPGIEFQDGHFSVTVGVCGYHGHLPLEGDDLNPDQHADHVLLGINGTRGTRLVNILLEPQESVELSKLLKKAAKNAENR